MTITSFTYPMDVKDLRAAAPVLEKYTYLNTASSGVLTRLQAEWRREQDEQFMSGASVYREHVFEQLGEVVTSLTRAFGGHPQRTALVPNYSLGMNMIAEALPPSCKVLTDSYEYPSVVLPLTSRGHTVEHTPLNGSKLESIIDYLEKHDVDVLAVSIVQWMDGRYFPISYFRAIRARFPDLLILTDGTQYMGTAPFDFDGSDIDILISSAYKWLMGGYGCGFMMLSEMALERLHIPTMGNATQMQRLLTQGSFDAQQFEPGHLDYLNFGTMQMGVDMLNSVGFAVVRKQIQALALHLKTYLVNMGFISHHILAGSYHTGIVHMPGSQSLVDQLAEHGILVSMREGIRVSFHGYNTESDINRLLQVLKLVV